MDFLFFPTRKATATIAKPFQWISLWLRRKVQFVSSVPGPHENRTTQISVTEANNTCVYDWRTSWGLREMSFLSVLKGADQSYFNLIILALLHFQEQKHTLRNNASEYVFVNKTSLPPLPAIQVRVCLCSGDCLTACFILLVVILCSGNGDKP